MKCLQRRGKTAVFAARQLGSGEPVAVKVSPPEGSGLNAVGVYRRLRQAPHPGLLQARDAFVDGGVLHLVLPWVPGGDLCDRVLGGGALAEAAAKRLLGRLAAALGHLHGALGVAHLDISPENVLLGGEGGAILVDYGSCRPLHSGGFVAGPHLGIKPQYAAPEVLASLAAADGGAAAAGALDLAKADIFSLGIVLFIALFGVPPFRLAMPHDSGFVGLRQAGARGALAAAGRAALAKAVEPCALALLDEMLRPDPCSRSSLASIRAHPWLLAAAAV